MWQEATADLLACRTCPSTYCARCLPEKAKQVDGSEISCEACQALLSSDLSQLQHDLMRCAPHRSCWPHVCTAPNRPCTSPPNVRYTFAAPAGGTPSSYGRWDPEQFAQHANVTAGEGFAPGSSS